MDYIFGIPIVIKYQVILVSFEVILKSEYYIAFYMYLNIF